MAALAWAIGSWPQRRYAAAGLAVAAAVPVLLVEVLFPGLGPDPFAPLNFVGQLAGLVPIGIVVARRRDRTLTAGVVLYALACVFAFVVPSAIGANVTRLGICFGVALVVILAWNERRRLLLLLVAAAVPLALAQWVPARQALLGEGNASMRAAYYTPLLRYLDARRPPARTRRGRADRLPHRGCLRRADVPARARLGAPGRHRQQPDLLRPRAP